MTEITHHLYDVTSKRKAKNYTHVTYGESLEIGDFEIEFLEAGHLLGAAQILIREGNETLLYTGDFCPEDLLTVNGARFPKQEIDVAIIDSTYGNQGIMFEPRANSRQSLFSWIIQQLNQNCIPVVNVGHLGGAQEIISFINTLTSNKLPILVSKKIASVCKIYEEVGVSLTYYQLEDKENHKLLHEKCLILVPRSFKDIDGLIKRFPTLDEKVVRCIITGQSAKYGFYTYDYSSSLSTHANFTELVDVVKLLDPKQVLTHYGYHKNLASTLTKDYNIPATSFSTCKPVDVNKLQRIRPDKDISSKMTKQEKAYGFVPLDYFLDD